MVTWRIGAGRKTTTPASTRTPNEKRQIMCWWFGSRLPEITMYKPSNQFQ